MPLPDFSAPSMARSRISRRTSSLCCPRSGAGLEDPGRRSGHPVRPSGILVFSGHRMFDLGKVPPGFVLFIVHDILGRVDRSHRDARFGQLMVDLLLLLLLHPGIQPGSDLHQMVGPVRPGCPNGHRPASPVCPSVPAGRGNGDRHWPPG